MTRRHYNVITVMSALLTLFEGQCTDKTTLRKLIEVMADRDRWPYAYALFGEIREKTLQAEKRDDRLALTQYAFEEACAKTLFNLTHPSAPFDPDSPFWILPRAVELKRLLGMPDPGDIGPLMSHS